MENGKSQRKVNGPRFLLRLPVYTVICPGEERLLQIICGKDRGAVVGTGICEGLPLEGAHGKNGIKGDQWIYCDRDQPGKENTYTFYRETGGVLPGGKFQGCQVCGNDGRRVNEQDEHSNDHVGDVLVGKIQNQFDQVRSFRGTEVSAPYEERIGAGDSADQGHIVV